MPVADSLVCKFSCTCCMPRDRCPKVRCSTLSKQHPAFRHLSLLRHTVTTHNLHSCQSWSAMEFRQKVPGLRLFGLEMPLLLQLIFEFHFQEMFLDRRSLPLSRQLQLFRSP